MNVLTSGTARFTKVAEAAGNPEVISLWTKPERDKRFMTAIHQNRVMTIKQEAGGSAKDFGIVGFRREKNASYLIFPRSLKPFLGQRIVGIKYDLIESPAPIGRIIKSQSKPKHGRSRKLQPAEWLPAHATDQASTAKRNRKKKFRVSIRFTATADIQQTVEASSSKEAKELALQQAVMPELRRGTVIRKVLKVE